jgi:hypothetical protein
MLRRLAAGLGALLLITGCQGSGDGPSPATEAAGATAPAGETAPPTGPAATDPAPPTEAAATTGPAAQGTTDEATMERVVRSWSAHLNAEENDALARLFALPALIAQGEGILEMRSYAAIAAWFAGLPCSGAVASITYDEPDVAVAVFELGDRPSSMCDASPGSLAAARFGFQDGKLVLWQQVPVPEQAQSPTTELEA